MPTMRVRREPPPFRRLTVRRVEDVSPRLIRVTLAGPELDGFAVEQPAASVRVLLPSSDGEALVIPTWNGNEFLFPDGTRPPIRTLTPYRLDPEALELDVEVVIHARGAASEWARTARPGSPTAVSGPGRGYAVDPDDPHFLLAGDETAIPAIGQLLTTISGDSSADVYIEIAQRDAEVPMPDRPNATVEWHVRQAGDAPGDALVAAVEAATIDPDTRVWAAGEAASMQRIRRHLLDVRAHPRARSTVRGYWKHGRRGGGEGDED
jgi:NADPH-dependent ferric siderophore reductase